MSDPDTELRDLARAHGVHLGFSDMHGTYHEAGPDTLRALLRGLGVEAGTERSTAEALAKHRASVTERRLPVEVIAPAGEQTLISVSSPCSWCLTDESGRDWAEGAADAQIAVPAVAPGYYTLVAKGRGWEDRTLVLCRPVRAPDLPGQAGLSRCWGLAGAIYGLRSDKNGGLGNYADLGHAGAALGGHGAQFLGINPVHALGWARREVISPYSPSHRGFFNADHIALPDLADPAETSDLVDYAAFRARHRPALEAAFDSQRSDADFNSWWERAPEDLQDFAAFEALSEVHGVDFSRWPTALRKPGRTARRAAGSRAQFHGWLQWQADRQIASAHGSARAGGMALGLYLDLAVGPRPDGAEVWMNSETIARGVSIGAPPDHLNPEGQSWTLAAHAPGRLAAAAYLPLRRMLGKLMSHCGILRIDHALGLMRSFWLPDDGSPGGYISQPLDSLLAIIVIEAHKTGCLVVGEDLGLVPQGLRQKMKEAGLYSYAVWQFESDAGGDLRNPAELPDRALACFGTHDTPTLRGFWYGRDIEWWRRLGWLSDTGRREGHATRSRHRASLRRLCAIAPGATPQQISDAIQGALARCPAQLVSIQLDDVFGVVEAQNLPGTIDDHPNWRRRLPVAVEEFGADPRLRRTAALMPAERLPAKIRRKTG